MLLFKATKSCMIHFRCAADYAWGRQKLLDRKSKLIDRPGNGIPPAADIRSGANEAIKKISNFC